MANDFKVSTPALSQLGATPLLAKGEEAQLSVPESPTDLGVDGVMAPSVTDAERTLLGSSGRTADVTAGCLETRSSLQQRIDRLGAQIDQAVVHGLISPQEGARLRQELTRIAYQLQSSSLDGMPGGSKDGLELALDKLGLELRAERQEGRIERNFKAGALDAKERAALLEELRANRQEISKLSTREQAQALNAKFDTASEHIVGERSDGELNPAQRILNFEERIQQGIDSGQLTDREAALLQSQVDALRKQVASDPTGKGLSSAINALDERIYQMKHNGELKGEKVVQVGAERLHLQAENLRKRIEAGSKDGTLSPSEEQALRARLAELEGALNAGNLTPERIAALTKDFTQLSADVFGSRHNQLPRIRPMIQG